MHQLYAATIEIVDGLKEARLEVVHLSAELAQVEYDLRLARARVERGLIRKAGGERALAPTVDDRARIFTLALQADSAYRAQLDHRREIGVRLEEAKVQVAALRDKLNVMLAAMKAEE